MSIDHEVTGRERWVEAVDERWLDDLDGSAIDGPAIEDSGIDRRCRDVARACALASTDASLCASIASSRESDGNDDGAAWLIAAARVLGACADVASIDARSGRHALLAAMCRAGLIAAEGCRTRCGAAGVTIGVTGDPAHAAYARCAASCGRAAVALRAALTDLAG